MHAYCLRYWVHALHVQLLWQCVSDQQVCTPCLPCHVVCNDDTLCSVNNVIVTNALVVYSRVSGLVLQVVGSVYIPEVNYIMMVLTVVVIAIFKTTVQLGNAYGKLPSVACVNVTTQGIPLRKQFLPILVSLLPKQTGLM